MKKLLVCLMLCMLVFALPQVAYAYEEPTVTITLDKESVKVGEMVTATYKIEGPRAYSNIRWDATMWVSEYEGQGPKDSHGKLTGLTGRFSYTPRFGKTLSMGISFEDETGRSYWYDSEEIPITGYTYVEPKIEIQYSHKAALIEETVTATYRIEGPRTYSDIRWDAMMWVSEYEGQGTKDSNGKLTGLTGSFSYAPRFGEMLSMGISFEDETGRSYWYDGDRIPIIGYSYIEPTVEIQYDKNTVAIGEKINATYKIAGSKAYSNIYWDATMWVSEYEGQGPRDSHGKLKDLSGQFSYVPRFGKLLSMGVAFEDETGRSYWYDGDRISILGYAPGYDIYTVIEGQNTQVSTSENALTFRADGEFEKFLGVQVDGKAVPSKYIKAWSGSTFVELSADYLVTLSEGEHELTIIFNDGVAVTKFTKAVASAELPQTGDNSMITMWMLLLAAAIAMMQRRIRKA